MKGITEKLIDSHLVSDGQEVAIKIDQTLTQDATGTMANLEFESLGFKKVQTELSISYVDHNTMQMGFENADDHEYLRTFSDKYGILYSKAGNGICHQVHLERFAIPGKTLLGADSHTPTGGGMGMLAIGAGGLDVAMAMGGKSFVMPKPKIVNIYLTGKLSEWISSKDVIFEVLRIFTTRGNVGTIFEYTGPGVTSLSVPERATIANMGAEVGVTTSVFPSDSVTKEYLEKQDRGSDWMELLPDEGAKYDKRVEIDLSSIEPLLAAPHSPDNVKKVTEVAGTPCQQVCVGSCVNSSYNDLMTIASILDGKKIASGMELIVAPGSKQVLQMISDNGALAKIVACGARIVESACGFCIGAGHAPASGSVSVRTGNRNFYARSGTKDADVYLAGVETACATALAGKITDPRTLGLAPKIELPSKFTIDDSMIIKPTFREKVHKGPNIGDAPKSKKFGNSLKGNIAIKVGDKITTDHIMPAGPYLKYRSNIKKYSEFVFANLDKTFSKRCMENRDMGLASIIIAGESYGQGSSREHAAICPMYLGVKVVIAKSMERIHQANLVNFGILPLIFENKTNYDIMEQGGITVINNLIQGMEQGAINIEVNSMNIKLKHNLSQRQVEIVLKGGLLNA